MGLIESRMTGIEVEGYVVALSGEAFKIELFPVLKVLDGQHVDRAAQSAPAIESTDPLGENQPSSKHHVSR